VSDASRHSEAMTRGIQGVGGCVATGRPEGRTPEAARRADGAPPAELETLGRAAQVGQSVRRVDAVSKVTGEWVFGADFRLPGMLHGKAVRSPFPHARVVHIDLEPARRVPGVRAVVTGKDAPYVHGSAIRDEPFLAGSEVRYAGEPVAAVAAVSEEAAVEAADRVRVEYEELPGIFDPLEAMRPGALLVHPDLGSYDREPVFVPYPGTNIVNHAKIRRGDVARGFRESDEVFEDVFTTQWIQHAPIEPHAAVAQVTADGRVTIWANTQSPYNFLREMAQALGLPQSRVRVIGLGVGGGFGSKLYPRLEPVAVALAMHAGGRPVKLTYTREEEFTACVTKHPAHIVLKTGAKRDGTLVARQITAVFNTGGYADTGPLVSRNGAFSGTGPYRLPHVWVDSYAVYTHNPLGGAFRGYGVPQLTWAHESQMDMMAHRLGLDPVEVRWRNLFDRGDRTCTGEVLSESVGIKATLRQALAASARPLPPRASRHVVRGRGIATMHKLTYTPTTSTAVVKLNADGSVHLLSSSVELGQGAYTALAQIVAERLGIPLERVTMAWPDTDYTPYDQSTSGSRTVFHMGNALLRAVADVARQLCELAAPILDVPVDRLEVRDGGVAVRGEAAVRKTFAELIHGRYGARGASLQGHGTFTPPSALPPDPETGQSPKVSAFWMYASHVADVEVDTETGRVRVLRIVAAHDVGHAINPAGVEAQIEGGVVQGLGATLHEEMLVRDGVVTNPSLVEYKLPTTRDVPEIVPIIVEDPHGEGPYGAKGLGEPVLAASSPAIANAVFNATGVRITDLPITPERVYRALRAAGAGPGADGG
jgi:CO/xanthine dehydrogenase Mo-binding subunit